MGGIERKTKLMNQRGYIETAVRSLSLVPSEPLTMPNECHGNDDLHARRCAASTSCTGICLTLFTPGGGAETAGLLFGSCRLYLGTVGAAKPF